MNISAIPHLLRFEKIYPKIPFKPIRISAAILQNQDIQRAVRSGIVMSGVAANAERTEALHHWQNLSAIRSFIVFVNGSAGF
jgi:hypothetical protein